MSTPFMAAPPQTSFTSIGTPNQNSWPISSSFMNTDFTKSLLNRPSLLNKTSLMTSVPWSGIIDDQPSTYNTALPNSSATPYTPPSFLQNSSAPPQVNTSGINWDGWFDTKGKGGMALGGLQTGIGAFNAWMGYKNQKFLEGYYGKQQNMQVEDFNNNVRSANDALRQREITNTGAAGIDPNSEEGKKRIENNMARWGAKPFVG